VDKLVSEMEGHLRLDGPAARAVSNTGDAYAAIMDSDVRTSALVLRALIAARPSHPLAAKLAMGLLADRRGGTWRSTQETAWALLALDDYRRAQEKAEPDFTARVFLGEAELASAPFSGRSVAQARASIPAANLTSAQGAPLAFAVDGKGRLFYEARLRYARKQMPDKPIDRGFYVRKTLRPVTTEGLAEALRTVPDAGARSFEGGSLVLADVVVVTPSPREFVVIDDPLPAGLEAVDMRLATTSGALARAELDDEPSPSWDGEGDEIDAERGDALAKGEAYTPSWFIREIRDDRVLFFVDHMAAGMYRYRYLARATTLGAFVLPPTRAEEMYTPEVFGRTGGGAVTVTAAKETSAAPPKAGSGGPSR
jgi:alpha-2-macroglobulin